MRYASLSTTAELPLGATVDVHWKDTGVFLATGTVLSIIDARTIVLEAPGAPWCQVIRLDRWDIRAFLASYAQA